MINSLEGGEQTLLGDIHSITPSWLIHTHWRWARAEHLSEVLSLCLELQLSSGTSPCGGKHRVKQQRGAKAGNALLSRAVSSVHTALSFPFTGPHHPGRRATATYVTGAC